MASTGGPVTGDDDFDRKVWQAQHAASSSSAGAMGIEYSLSCPQGGDGTEGDIVSQNAGPHRQDHRLGAGGAATRTCPSSSSSPAAVTSIAVIVKAIREVLARYPDKKAGVTLANTFPTPRASAPGARPAWDEGIVVGMSGDGVTPICNLTLASVGQPGRDGLGQRRADGLPGGRPLPGPGRAHRAVLHHRR